MSEGAVLFIAHVHDITNCMHDNGMYLHSIQRQLADVNTVC